jgi:hypothetical protein
MAKVTMIHNPKTGETLFEVDGVVGESCTDITAAIIAGNEQLEQQYTEEYYTPDVMPDYVHDMGGEE